MKGWRALYRWFDGWTTWGGSGVADEAQASSRVGCSSSSGRTAPAAGSRPGCG
jgi:hypothetical protein